MSRDSQRSLVYDAEDLSAEQTVLVEKQEPVLLAKVALDLCSSLWWHDHFDPRQVDVVVNRSALRSYYATATRRVSLSPQALDLNTLCHELAHAAAFDLGGTGPVHGACFRAVHVLIRTAVLGEAAGDDLAEVYAQFGLAVEMPAALTVPNGPTVLDPNLYSAERIVGRPVLEADAARRPIAL